VAQLRALPLSNRAKRPTSAQSRAHRATVGGAFSSLLAGRKCVPVQKAGDQSAWRRARLDIPKIRAVFLGGEMIYRKRCIEKRKSKTARTKNL